VICEKAVLDAIKKMSSCERIQGWNDYTCVEKGANTLSKRSRSFWNMLARVLTAERATFQGDNGDRGRFGQKNLQRKTGASKRKTMTKTKTPKRKKKKKEEKK